MENVNAAHRGGNRRLRIIRRGSTNICVLFKRLIGEGNLSDWMINYIRPQDFNNRNEVEVHLYGLAGGVAANLALNENARADTHVATFYGTTIEDNGSGGRVKIREIAFSGDWDWTAASVFLHKIEIWWIACNMPSPPPLRRLFPLSALVQRGDNPFAAVLYRRFSVGPNGVGGLSEQITENIIPQDFNGFLQLEDYLYHLAGGVLEVFETEEDGLGMIARSPEFYYVELKQGLGNAGPRAIVKRLGHGMDWAMFCLLVHQIHVRWSPVHA